jgi:hypothetical protein
MAAPNVDTATILAAVEKAKTVQASAIALINGFKDKVIAAVTAAIQADDEGDQGTVDAAVAAINAAASDLNTSSEALGTAVTTNTPNA